MIIEIKFEKGVTVNYKRTSLYFSACKHLGIIDQDTKEMCYQLSNRMISLKLNGTQCSIEFDDYL